MKTETFVSFTQAALTGLEEGQRKFSQMLEVKRPITPLRAALACWRERTVENHQVYA